MHTALVFEPVSYFLLPHTHSTLSSMPFPSSRNCSHCTSWKFPCPFNTYFEELNNSHHRHSHRPDSAFLVLYNSLQVRKAFTHLNGRYDLWVFIILWCVKLYYSLPRGFYPTAFGFLQPQHWLYNPSEHKSTLLVHCASHINTSTQSTACIMKEVISINMHAQQELVLTSQELNMLPGSLPC